MSTGAAACNPSLAVCRWVLGDASIGTTLCAIAGEVLGGVAAIPLLGLVMKSDVMEFGPSIETGTSVYNAALCESILGLYILLSKCMRFFIKDHAKETVLDSCLYAVLLYSVCSSTGASMNPAYALAWGIWSDSWKDPRFMSVYVVAPVIAGTTGGLLWEMGVRPVS